MTSSELTEAIFHDIPTSSSANRSLLDLNLAAYQESRRHQCGQRSLSERFGRLYNTDALCRISHGLIVLVHIYTKALPPSLAESVPASIGRIMLATYQYHGF